MTDDTTPTADVRDESSADQPIESPTESDSPASTPISDEDKTHIRRLQVLRRTGAVNMFTDLRKGLHLLLTEDAAEETFDWVQENFEDYLSGEWVQVSVTDESDPHDEAYLREDERATAEFVESIMEDLTRDEMRRVADIDRDDPEWIPKRMLTEYKMVVYECRYQLRQADTEAEHGREDR